MTVRLGSWRMSSLGMRRSQVMMSRLAARARSRSATVVPRIDRKSTRLNSSHTEIYTLSLHDALPISGILADVVIGNETLASDDEPFGRPRQVEIGDSGAADRSEEHTSELQSHRDLHSFPTRRSSDLWDLGGCRHWE